MTPATTWQDLLRPGEAEDYFARGNFPPFDPAATGYSADNARWLAELSRLVYRHDQEEDDPPPAPTRSHYLAAQQYRQNRFFLCHETGTQVMLVEKLATPSHAVLVFRGTEQTLKDLVTDIHGSLSLLERTTIAVHSGFSRALDSVWQPIKAELATLGMPVYYTGHSLGGALATLAAARHAPRALYTFGSPRVGNQAFVDSLSGMEIYRIVDDQDAITDLPPAVLGYRHAGQLVRLHGQHSPSLSRLISPPKSWADHAPVNYVDRIDDGQFD